MEHAAFDERYGAYRQAVEEFLDGLFREQVPYGDLYDSMLQNGATKVYAVDVGYGQLAWSLRSDPRVVCLERTNARYLTREQVPDVLDFASVDVSFISLKLILPPLCALLKNAGQTVCLVKPQFEAGREKVGKKGVVRDPAVHLEVLEAFFMHASDDDDGDHPAQLRLL